MITFLKSGILTTIQDLGRNGYRASGINPNGVMDTYAFRKLNILLGNEETEGILEFHFPSPEILFEQDAIIAIGGADFQPEIDGKTIENDKLYFIKLGSVLKFRRKNYGERCYLGIQGGFEIEQWLGSVSTNLIAKIGGKKIEKGDKLSCKSLPRKQNIFDKKIKTFIKNENSEIRILAGNEFGFLTEKSRQRFESQEFMVTQNSNRMGYRLESEPLELVQKIELLSSTVDFGTIQILPNGQLIILMADHQTTGGYPRVGHVISTDLPKLAQMGVSKSFRLKFVSIEEAERLFIAREKEFEKLKVSIRLYSNH